MKPTADEPQKRDEVIQIDDLKIIICGKVIAFIRDTCILETRCYGC